MIPLYNNKTIRSIEAEAFVYGDSFAVMMRAGKAIAQQAILMTKNDNRAILIIAGPGNNGGDALIAAASLR